MSTSSGSHAPGEQPEADADGGRTTGATSVGGLGLDRLSVVHREKEQYGGIKVGSAFFGWLTATGTAVLLTALLTGAGAVVGVATDTDASAAADQAGDNAATVGLFSAIALLVVLFISYFCGGYVAGRMARFDGAKQGIAVWLWAVAIAIVVAILTALAGAQFAILDQLGGFPTLPLDGQTLSTAAIITAVIAAAVALVGAVLGGIAGMRFHRKVDKAGFGR